MNRLTGLRPFLVACVVLLSTTPLLAQKRIIDRPRLVPNAFGPSDLTFQVGFAPDSRRIFAAGFGKTVSTWNVGINNNGDVLPTYTGALRWTISRADRGRIRAFAASESSNLIAFAGSGALDPYTNIMLCDSGTRQIVKTLTGKSSNHTQAIQHLDFSPDGSHLLSVDRMGNVVVWDKATNWQPRSVYKSQWSKEFRFLPAIFLDNNTIVMVEPTDPSRVGLKDARWQLVIYQIQNGIRRIGAVPAVHVGAVTALARGKNGAWASADFAGRIYIGQGTNPVKPRRMRYYKRSPSSLAFGASGILAITNFAYYQGRGKRGKSYLELWDTNLPDSKKPLFQKSLSIQPTTKFSTQQDVFSVAISADNTLLLTQDPDSSDLLLFRIADINGNLLPRPLDNPTRISGRGRRIDRVAFRSSPDYQIGISTQRGGPLSKVFRIDPPAPAAPGLTDADAVPAAEWRQPDASAGGWKFTADTTFRSSDETVKQADFAATVTNRNGVSGKIRLSDFQGWLSCYCFIPGQNGQPAAVAIGTETNNGIYVYSLPTANSPPRLLRYYRDHSGAVTSISSSQDGRYLVSGSEDQTVKIWSLAGVLQGTVTSRSWGATFTAQGNRLVVSNVNPAGIAYARSMRNGDVIKSFAGFDDNKKVFRAATAAQMLQYFETLPIYRQKLLTLERNGQLVPNPDDPSGQGRRLIVPGWEPLLTLFVDRNNEWALFTPEGYFDSSVAEGGDLFGWHINQRINNAANPNAVQELTPRFLKGANLQKEMEKPDVIRRILRQGNVIGALQAMNEQVPPNFRQFVSNIAAQVPQVRITRPLASDVFPTGNAFQVQAEVVYPQGQQPNNFEVRATATHRFLGPPIRNFNAATNTETLTWNAAATGASERIQVTAHENGVGTQRFFNSDEVFVRVGVGAQQSQPSPGYELNILTLSSEEYEIRGLPELDFPHDDVEAVVKLLQQNTGLYEIGTVEMMRDADLTPQGFQDMVQRLQSKINSSKKPGTTQLLLVYVAGHGKDVEGVYYYLPSTLKSTTAAAIQEDAFPWHMLNQITDIGVQTMFLLDTCRAGNAVAQVENNNRPQATVNRELKSQLRPIKQRGSIVLAATSEGEEAYEDEQYRGGHGAFTASFLEGIEGAADKIRGKGSSRVGIEAGLQQDEIVTVNELIQFVIRHVYASTDKRQRPCYTPKADEYADFYARKLVKVRK